MEARNTVEVTPDVLKEVARSFLKQNTVMTLRVWALSIIIGSLLVVGAFWYIGALDRWIPSASSTSVAATAADLVRRLGAVVMMIFLVRIFVPLLRYAAELEIFYRSRAAALEILATGVTHEKVRLDVRTLLDLLSSDKIRLAAAPESPIAELMATVRTPEKGHAGTREKS
jgi:ABC-type protease/lipase transport system fused ATPase/permease subunit